MGLEIQNIHQGNDFLKWKKLSFNKLISNKNYKLIIFLHPKKLESKTMDLINIHYQKLLGQKC